MSVEASVTSIKASIKTLNSFLSGIDGWYEEYSGDHTSTDCKNLKGLGLEGDVKKAKEDVRSLIKTYEKYLDDTKWIATLREYKSTWNKAARDCAEADLEVLSKKLRATGSWTGKAGKAYRATVTGQQSAIGTAEQGADTMSRGCDSAAVAGETFFTELDTAFKSCAKDLPTKADFPEWSGTNQPGERVPMIERVPNSCDSHTDDVGKSAAAGGLTDAQAAMKNLETAIASCFKTYPPHAYPYSGAAPNVTMKDFVSSWPESPGQ